MAEQSASTLISVDQVTKEFASIKAVSDLSFEIRRGEVFALLGPNGAGKTTMVRMLVGITRPDSGCIRYPDVSHGELVLGYMPEERGLYLDQSVLKILEYFGRLHGMKGVAARQEGLCWLERFDLKDRAGDKLETLSKGNQQKVQFIATILHRPDWIILDEPFSGLDPLNQELFLDLIEELRREGATILLSSHQMNLVEQIADHILVIDRGEAALGGTMAEIRQRGTSREKIVCRLDDGADLEGVIGTLGGCVSLRRIEALPGGELAAWIAPDATLQAALAELCAVAPVTAVNSALVSLHEIFIQTIGGGERGTP
jgi:ABC-2 type transport system ATP-binding protein